MAAGVTCALASEAEALSPQAPAYCLAEQEFDLSILINAHANVGTKMVPIVDSSTHKRHATCYADFEARHVSTVEERTTSATKLEECLVLDLGAFESVFVDNLLRGSGGDRAPVAAKVTDTLIAQRRAGAALCSMLGDAGDSAAVALSVATCKARAVEKLVDLLTSHVVR